MIFFLTNLLKFLHIPAFLVRTTFFKFNDIFAIGCRSRHWLSHSNIWISRNKWLVITLPDKSTGVVIFDYQDYVNKMMTILKVTVILFRQVQLLNNIPNCRLSLISKVGSYLLTFLIWFDPTDLLASVSMVCPKAMKLGFQWDLYCPW